jgi:hypothetical protein
VPAVAPALGEPKPAGPAICWVRLAPDKSVGFKPADHAGEALPADLQIPRKVANRHSIG